jgi:hypothetical protein
VLYTPSASWQSAHRLDDTNDERATVSEADWVQFGQTEVLFIVVFLGCDFGFFFYKPPTSTLVLGVEKYK